MMDKRRLNKLCDLAEEIRHECCDKYVLQGWNGACCYDSGNDKVEYCPFDETLGCATDSFIDALYIIANRDKGDK